LAGGYDQSARIHEEQPALRRAREDGKRILLYLPTYRTGESSKTRALAAALDPDRYLLVAKEHPVSLASTHKAESGEIPVLESCDRPGCEIMRLDEFSAETLLCIADAVVTDYSSLAFSAGLVGIPVYYWVYDIEGYRCRPGLNIDPERVCADCTAREAGDLAALLERPYDRDAQQRFLDEHIETRDGRCTERLATLLFACLDGEGGAQ
ncbi:MAG: CDP-glycerol glycerophosphotransferase family protein, partial [Clostridiales Family XIII bacterium]|nr:CDP-glycerol glycerophosphotransferase family protein [Clostridiales Family XIII bacterium]